MSFRALVERLRVTIGRHDLLVTISLRGAIAEVGDTVEALYRAKEGGRKRVVLSGDAESPGS